MFFDFRAHPSVFRFFGRTYGYFRETLLSTSTISLVLFTVLVPFAAWGVLYLLSYQKRLRGVDPVKKAALIESGKQALVVFGVEVVLLAVLFGYAVIKGVYEDHVQLVVAMNAFKAVNLEYGKQVTDLRKQTEQLKAENERLRAELAAAHRVR